MADECVFCISEGGEGIWRDGRCRVVLADETLAGFCRVIWNAHAREMTDLAPSDRDHLMHVVFAVESSLIHQLAPLKMNLASLGNVTPHVHWHVIPRFADDSHYPQPVWGARQRDGRASSLPADFRARMAADIDAALAACGR